MAFFWCIKTQDVVVNMYQRKSWIAYNPKLVAVEALSKLMQRRAYNTTIAANEVLDLHRFLHAFGVLFSNAFIARFRANHTPGMDPCSDRPPRHMQLRR